VAFSINTNVASLQSQNYLRTNSDFQGKTINRVTSGLRIIQSGDDAAGLAVANGLRSDQAVLTQGIRNANDGLSTLQTIDGGMGNISQLLDRARTLATQSASDTFTGDRSVLDGEFQNVLTEINRQAQSIGMISGGSFAKSMSVFIGGGRTNTSGSNAIVNGSVTVSLGNSLLDTTSLGLAANGVTGADMSPGASALSTAVAAVSDKTFDFFLPGSTTPVSVDFSTGLAAVKSQSDLVNLLNNAIASAATGSTQLAAANIRASVNSAGLLAFTSAQAFAVQAHTGGGAAQALLGTAAVKDVSASSVAAVAVAAVTGSGTQNVIFNWTNAAGVAQAKTVTLTNGTTGLSQASIVAAINGDGTLQGAGIFAVVKAGAVDFMKADGGAFTISTAYVDFTAGATEVHTGGGVTGAATFVSSKVSLAGSSAVDITNSANATSAVTALSTAVTNLGQIQGTVGRAENQLTYAMNLAQSQLTNEGTAESRIRDADLASEAANLTKAQILMQAGVAALAQANAAPQAVLSLLKG
jgi:flagellin